MLVKTFWTGQIWTNILSINEGHLVTSTKIITHYIIKRTGYREFNAQGAHLWLKVDQISKNDSYMPFILWYIPSEKVGQFF